MVVEDTKNLIAVLAGKAASRSSRSSMNSRGCEMAISDERVDLAGEQINAGQQAERAMTFVLIPLRSLR